MIFRDITEICLRKIKQSKARPIYFLGADDTGKTTLTKELANRLILEGSKVAIIGADPGQSLSFPGILFRKRLIGYATYATILVWI